MAMIPAVIAARNASSRSSRNYNAGSYHNSKSDSGKPPCSALVILAIASCCLITSALWFLTSAVTGEREQEVLQFGQALETWAGVEPGFARLDITVQSDSIGAPVELEADHTADGFHDSANGDQLPDYDALTFRSRRLPFGFVPEIDLSHVRNRMANGHGLEDQQVGPNVSFTFALRGEGGETSHLTAGPYPLARIRAHWVSGPQPEMRCKQLRGALFFGRCWVLSRLKMVCVQVAPGRSGGAWRLAPRSTASNLTYGCTYGRGTWEAPSYQVVPAPFVSSVSFGDLLLAVRSRDDPYLRSLELTDGTLDFGMTADDDRVLGLVMLVVGAAMCLPPCVAFATRRASDDSGFGGRRIGRQYMDFEEEDDNVA